MKGIFQNAWRYGLPYAIVLFLILSLGSVVLLPIRTSAYTPHTSIQIIGNSQFTSANGVTGGNGTPTDPYIIDGWDIEVNGLTGIEIQGTDANFIIRNNYIHHPPPFQEYTGIRFYGVANGSIQNTTITGFNYGVLLDLSDNLAISHNNVSSNWVGVQGTSVVNITFDTNSLSNGYVGIWMFSSNHITAADNNVSGGSAGIYLYESSYGTIRGNRIVGGSTGILLYFTGNNTVTDNNVTFSGQGIRVSYGNNTVLEGNSVFNGGINWAFGLLVEDTDHVTVKRNILTSSEAAGLSCSRCLNALIEDNDIAYNGDGIAYGYSTDAEIRDNRLSKNGRGVHLESSERVTISNNAFKSNGITLYGDALSNYNSHTITSDNLVNSLPVYYYKDCSGLNVDGIPLGQLIVANCKDVTAIRLWINDTDSGIQMAFVENVRVEENYIATSKVNGIFLYSLKNATVTRNNVSGSHKVGANMAYDVLGLDVSYATCAVIDHNVIASNDYGFRAFVSNNITIADNNVVSSEWLGIWAIRSDNATVRDNGVYANGFNGIWLDVAKHFSIRDNNASSNFLVGIYVTSSINGTIIGNNVVANENGIVLGPQVIDPPDFPSREVLVYHNNIINNTVQAKDGAGGSNSWDNGYPSGGNYWSDYNGTDNCSGPNQDICPDPDGIGDTPMPVEFMSRDRYPLMKPHHGQGPSDVNPPIITDLVIPPPPVEVFTSVRISATVEDNVGVDHVMLNITGPSGYDANVSMTRETGIWWYLERPYDILGTYHASVWAFDTSGNAANLSGSFTVVDIKPPVLSDIVITPMPPIEVLTSAKISVNVTDDVSVDRVVLNISGPEGLETNVSMVHEAGDRWSRERSCSILGTYYIAVWAFDTSGNKASLGSDFTVVDSTRPVIAGVAATPPEQKGGASVDISANVTDNFDLHLVLVEVFNHANVSIGTFLMTLNGSDGKYHHAAVFSEPGSWSFVITAEDGSGNNERERGYFRIVEEAPGGPGIIAIAVGAGAVTGVVIIGLEPVRLLLLTLLAAPLYRKKLKGKDDSVLRGMILGYIVVHPGDAYADIKRNLNLTNGGLTYHLARLEKDGEIKARVRGARTRYYPASMPMPTDDGGELHEIQKQLLAAVDKDPGIPVSILAQQVGVSSQLALYHLRKLSRENLLVLERRGIKLRAYPATHVGSSSDDTTSSDKQT